MPRDPFAVEGGGLVDEALSVGDLLLDGILDALDRRGLFGLYEAVLSLGRDDLERAVFAFVCELMLGGGRVEMTDAEEAADREPPQGRRVLAELMRPVLRDGPDGIAAAVRARPNRELRWALIQPLEEMRGGALRERGEGEGP